MEMRVSDAINTFVGSFFPLHSDPKLALLFNIDASFTDYGYSRNEKDEEEKVRDEFNFRCTTLILITRPMNNAHVYTRILPPLEGFDFSLGTEMRLVSTHNSCWKDAVESTTWEVNKLGMEEYEKLEDYEQRPPWGRLSSHINFSIFQKPTFLYLKEPHRLAKDYCDNNSPHGRWLMRAEKKLTTTQEVAQYMNNDASNYTTSR